MNPQAEMHECCGWTILCPDRVARSFPYHNEDDARFDARYRSENGCRFEKDGVRKPYPNDPKAWVEPPCPGGVHTAEPIVFQHRKEVRMAEREDALEEMLDAALEHIDALQAAPDHASALKASARLVESLDEAARLTRKEVRMAERKVHVGDVVVFHDRKGQAHNALVTCVFAVNQYCETNPLVNLVYVSGDESRQDTYGRQIECDTSVPHASDSGVHGYVWRHPDEPAPAYTPPTET